jgi:tetratricopeptide (TPR) repeat protein
MKKLLLSAVILFTAAQLKVNAQQLKLPAPSPLQTIKQAFALSDITIEYSRPGVKNRIIYGDLVPFGKIWRTGANQSTKITFGEDVKVEGNPVAAGTYALYTVPGKDSWDIMLYKDLTLGGDVAEYKKENELLRVKASPAPLSNKIETFTIGFADVTPKSLNIELSWEKTRVAFAVTVDNDEKIMKNISSSLEKDARPYYQAATYYYENDKDMKQALEWVNKAIESNPKAYYMVHLKAKIYMKMNDKANAIATAEKSMAIAKEEKNDDYVRLNEKLIAEAKK